MTEEVYGWSRMIALMTVSLFLTFHIVGDVSTFRDLGFEIALFGVLGSSSAFICSCIVSSLAYWRLDLMKSFCERLLVHCRTLFIYSTLLSIAHINIPFSLSSCQAIILYQVHRIPSSLSENFLKHFSGYAAGFMIGMGMLFCERFITVIQGLYCRQSICTTNHRTSSMTANTLFLSRGRRRSSALRRLFCTVMRE